ncbi:MAG: LTA synthase family protein [Coriobacteriales bacterium]|nr:LTA synthase family protein [Coriobacteriales bacterium]
MSILYAVFPLAALAALIVTSVAYARKRAASGNPLTASSWGWMLPSAAVLAFLAAWGLMGLLEGTFALAAIPASCAVIALCGAVCLRRDSVWSWVDGRPEGVRRASRIVLPILIVVLSFLCIEVPFNGRMPFGGPSYFWLEMLLVGLLQLALYFLGQRHAALCGLGVGFCLFVGIAQHFVKRFKNAAILPTDLLVLNTAAAVGKEYVFSFTEQAMAGFAVAALAICALSLVRPPVKKAQGAKVARPVALNLGASVLCTGLLAFCVLVPSYMGLLGVQMKYWYSIDYYQMQGFFPSFIAVLQDMPIRKPEGYSNEEAERITKSYADEYRASAKDDPSHQAAARQFDEVKPSVIVVMNESFADLSIYDGMHAGYEGPQFFKNGLNDSLLRGTLNVTVHGAGTCNTEFEFLTGNALGFIGAGKYPYSIYDLSRVDALAAEFKGWGYKTCAIHPNHASNWNRDKIYPAMGFDQFLSIDDFGGMARMSVDRVTPNDPHCEVFHSGVSDIETYNRMLQMLEEDSSPQFFFDVTMANHGSYNQNNIPEEYQTNYYPTDFEGDETPERLNEYLACIQKSDDDLKEFITKLRELDRPVVLVFFGDHQPSVSAAYNDYWYTDEPEDVHARRAFSSDYVIWANYDVAGHEKTDKNDETSVDLLAAITLDIIGAPVSTYQAAQLGVRESILSLSSSGYKGADGQWYAPDAQSDYATTYRDLSYMEYLNFATKL